MMISSRIDPYQQSHPMPRERVAALDDLVKTNPYWEKLDPPELQLRHDLMRAKLAGFLERQDSIARRYPTSDTSLPARYARAIAAHRFAGVAGAMTQIDALIQTQPNNPYFHELKGQSLLEGARPADAIAPLRRAAALAPNATLIRIMLGPGAGRDRRCALRRRGDRAAARRDAARAGRAGGLLPACHGVRPQGQLCGSRSRLRAGGAGARRHQDRARACGARQDAVSDRIARLGQVRRHRRAEAAVPAARGPISPSARRKG